MAPNPLRWPEIEQMGRALHDCLQPALKQLTSGCDSLDDKARWGLERLQSWLSAPCAATVKLDGTNVGVDNSGLIVGRNMVVEQDTTYQKVDVWSLLDGYQEKAEAFRAVLQGVAGKETIAKAMLYGELCILGKYDYANVGIFKGWLCFGAVLSLDGGAEDDEAPGRLSSQLRTQGYNTKPMDGKVLVVPNAELEALLTRLGIVSVFSGYRPAGITEAQWAAHDGQGCLPRFLSMRQLLLSDWAQRLLLPADGVSLCEGLVVASEADGTLLKWKHAGEELGKVPELLNEIVCQLRKIGSCQLLPEGTLEVCERLLLVATTKPHDSIVEKKAKPVKGEDTEALAVWESALTKFDTLEEVFDRGAQAKQLREAELIEQVAWDLIADYGVADEEAQQRATKVVRREVGKSFGIWRKGQNSAD
eukprot:TRINITY_DN33312_c0_g1_i1.p1 TRINITY_DN33312_c0_g1~~TRINITY_DN33312_c0_g1_i1.p1  ORF type:complete len:439 (+),score=93.20 TRINITY_DN33312_c0_g1_i1:63-1319(+)